MNNKDTFETTTNSLRTKHMKMKNENSLNNLVFDNLDDFKQKTRENDFLNPTDYAHKSDVTSLETKKLERNFSYDESDNFDDLISNPTVKKTLPVASATSKKSELIDTTDNTPSQLLFSGNDSSTSKKTQTSLIQKTSLNDENFFNESFSKSNSDFENATIDLPSRTIRKLEDVALSNLDNKHLDDYKRNVARAGKNNYSQDEDVLQLNVGNEVIVPSRSEPKKHEKSIDVGEIISNIEKLENKDANFIRQLNDVDNMDAIHYNNNNNNFTKKQDLHRDYQPQQTPRDIPVNQKKKFKLTKAVIKKASLWTLAIAAWLLVAVPMIIIATKILSA